MQGKGVVAELNEQEKKVLAHLAEHQRIVSSEVAQLCNVGQRSARDILKKMIEKRWIVKKGERKRDAYYVVNQV